MANEKESLKMKDVNESLSCYKVQSLEGVSLVGDIEIEVDLCSGAQPLLAQSLSREFTNLALQLFDFSRAMGYPVDAMLHGGGPSGKKDGIA